MKNEFLIVQFHHGDYLSETCRRSGFASVFKQTGRAENSTENLTTDHVTETTN